MLQISNLILEITRKCNLRCAHCLRGNVQHMTMSNGVLCNSLQHIESICTLTVTGGEPSLAPEVLENLNEQLFWRKISVGAFYIVTNGMSHNRFRKFLTAIERLYSWCDEKDACILTVSRDQFHPFDENPWKNLIKFEIRDEYGRHWGEYPSYFHPDERRRRIERVLGEGRAVETQTGFESQEQQTPWKFDGDYVIDPLVYISANGNVVSCCNMSYDRIDREAKGNVLIKALPEIIESYCIKTVQEEGVAWINL